MGIHFLKGRSYDPKMNLLNGHFGDTFFEQLASDTQNRIHRIFLPGSHGVGERTQIHMSSVCWWLKTQSDYIPYMKYYTPKGGYDLALDWVP